MAKWRGREDAERQISEMDRIEAFANLFTGNRTAYGGDEGLAIWKPVTLATYEQHLIGVEPIGIYPIAERNNAFDPMLVKWGCCDIDTGDWNEAYRLATALRGMGLNPWVERSRSKGWHVWIFVDEWINASFMRRCLKVAYAAIDLPAKEANPKSESLRPSQLGNYVRLPYKGGLILESDRQTMMFGWDKVWDGEPITFRQFIDLDPHNWYSPLYRVIDWAGKWYERPKALKVSGETEWAKLDCTNLTARIGPVTHRVWLEGPRKADRSATLQALAYEFAKIGFKAEETMALIMSADSRWGKYHLRVDGEQYVADIVNRAYS